MNKFILNIKRVFSKLITGDFVLSPIFYIGVTLLVVFLFTRSCHPHVPTTTEKGIGQLVPIKTTIDKDGVQHAVIPTNVVSKEIMEYRLDSLSRALKYKYVTSATQAALGVDTVFREKLVFLDTSGNYVVRHSDPYLEMVDSGNLNTQEASLTLKLTDTLTHVIGVKKHLFKRSEVETQILNRNPYVKVNAGTSWVTKERKALLVLGPAVNYGGYISNGQVKLGFSAGISLTLNLITLKSR